MRRRILLLVVGMTTLVVLAFAIPLALLIRPTIAQRVQNATTDQAKSVTLFIAGSSPTAAQLASTVTSLSSSTGRPTSVTLPTGATIGDAVPGSPGLPGGEQPGAGRGGPGPGGTTEPHAELRSVPGGQVATASVTISTGTYVVQVYLSGDALHAGEGKWWLLLIGGSVLLLAIGVTAAEVLTRRIVRPLLRTAETAQLLATGDVTARAPTNGPREVADVGAALNRLADRIDELIAEERETVADMSHRLRTPLTALRLDAESLRSPEEAERIGGHVSALERMLTAVIHAARRPQREGRMPSCDAADVVGERVAFWSALADEQGRVTSLDLPESPLPVRASTEDLAAAVDALLENVIAHTPEGTAFSVRLSADEPGARLEVSDDGPGLPTDADVRGRSDRGSSGLGLDIARRCAQAGGGSMSIARSASGGALVTLLLHAP